MKNLLILILAIAIASCGNSKKNKESESKKMNIAAAGATFPLPFYNLAFKTYQEKTGNTVTYGGIGSGGGIRSLKDKIVDFGGSDATCLTRRCKRCPTQRYTSRLVWEPWSWPTIYRK